jgi:hypothetical protein
LIAPAHEIDGRGWHGVCHAQEASSHTPCVFGLAAPVAYSVRVATRKEAGMTQEQLAEKLGRPQSFVAKVEIGERRLDVVEFVEMAKAMKVDPVVLFNRFLRW